MHVSIFPLMAYLFSFFPSLCLTEGLEEFNSFSLSGRSADCKGAVICGYFSVSRLWKLSNPSKRLWPFQRWLFD